METKFRIIDNSSQIIENLRPAEAARYLIAILQATYGKHNLSSSVEQTEESICAGRLVPFFSKNELGNIEACAALVNGDNTVEIGRAANAPGGKNGGKLMLHAIDTWQNNPYDRRSLVAEIRMAAPFEGIAGGQGSQATLLQKHKVGMVPHAFLPTFHHPGPEGPDRQELFCFSSKVKHEIQRNAPKHILLPDVQNMNPILIQELLDINGFHIGIELISKKAIASHRIPVVQTSSVPFRILEINGNGSDLDDFSKPEENNPFDLCLVNSFSQDMPVIANSLSEHGFQLAGISAPFQGELNLLFGKLHPCLLAPTEPMKGFPSLSAHYIMTLDTQFR